MYRVEISVLRPDTLSEGSNVFRSPCNRLWRLRRVVRRRGSRIFLDNGFTDGGEVVSLTHSPAALYPQKGSGFSFLLEAELTPGP
jgi:hypothetical protein